MDIRQLTIAQSYEIVPRKFDDDRGTFLESFRADRLEQFTGMSFVPVQSNASVSKRGVVRGIHFADVPVGQAKYVSCLSGAVMDYVIDIRVGSPTFGQWDSVRLDDVARNSVFIAEGLGHAFVALSDDAIVNYLVSSVFTPTAEHGINPLDPEVALVFPAEAGELRLSPKDQEAPGLSEARDSGLLPLDDDVRKFYAAIAIK